MARVVLVALTTAFLAHTGVAVAQEVGRSTVGDREVILFQNGTWRYVREERPVDEACVDKTRLESDKLPLSYCLSEAEWARDTVTGPFEAVYVHRQQELYLGVISERVTFTEEALREAIVFNAQQAAGLTPIKILKEEDVDIAGTNWSFLNLEAIMSGVEFQYWNYSRAVPRAAVQFVFWTTDEHAAEAGPIAAEVSKTLRWEGE
ncbi:MAG: hypothetical protein ROR55_14025 [Devosia sp.]